MNKTKKVSCIFCETGEKSFNLKTIYGLTKIIRFLDQHNVHVMLNGKKQYNIFDLQDKYKRLRCKLRIKKRGEAMASFEEFLKAKQVESNEKRIGYPAMIHVYDLGNWAWEQFLKRVKEHDDNFSFKENLEFYSVQINRWKEFTKDAFICPCDIFIEIAVACLGRTEIKKRLKELK